MKTGRLIFIIAIIIMSSLAVSIMINTFDSQTTGNLTFSNANNVTKYFNISAYADVTYAVINFSIDPQTADSYHLVETGDSWAYVATDNFGSANNMSKAVDGLWNTQAIFAGNGSAISAVNLTVNYTIPSAVINATYQFRSVSGDFGGDGTIEAYYYCQNYSSNELLLVVKHTAAGIINVTGDIPQACINNGSVLTVILNSRVNKSWAITNIYEESVTFNVANTTYEPWMEVGTIDGIREWNYTGISGLLDNKTQNFYSSLNYAISGGNCNCTGCSRNIDNCSIPFTFYLSNDLFNDGILRYSAVNITYSLIDPKPYLVSPANNSKRTSFNINFTCNTTDLLALSNVTLYVWHSNDSLYNSTSTNISGTQNSTTWSVNFNESDRYHWNCFVKNNYTLSSYNVTNYTAIIDIIAPSVLISEPSTQTYNTNTSIPLKFSVSDNLSGAGSCWYNVKNINGTVVISNTTLGSCANKSFNLSSDTLSYNLTLFANDTLGNEGLTSVTFGVTLVLPAVLLDVPSDNQWSANPSVMFNFSVNPSNSSISTCELWEEWSGTWNKNYTWVGNVSGEILQDADMESNDINSWPIFEWGAQNYKETISPYSGARNLKIITNNSDQYYRTIVSPSNMISSTGRYNVQGYVRLIGSTSMTSGVALGNSETPTSSTTGNSSWTSFNFYGTPTGSVSKIFLKGYSASNDFFYTEWDEIHVTIMTNKTFTLPDGSFKWNVWCNDTRGNSNWAFNNRTINIDTILPNASINYITTLAGSQTITFETNITDTNINVCKYTIYNNSGVIDGLNNNVSFTCGSEILTSATVSAYGTYNLSVSATDLAGNVAFDSLQFTTSPLVSTTVIGGGGGLITVIVSNFSMMTVFGGNSYEFDLDLPSDTIRTEKIDFINLEDTPILVDISCKYSSGVLDLCDFVTIENESLVLPVSKSSKVSTVFTLDVPGTIPKGVYEFYISGQVGETRQSIGIKVNTDLGAFRLFIAKLTGSRKYSFVPVFRIPNLVVALLSFVFAFTVLYFGLFLLLPFRYSAFVSFALAFVSFVVVLALV